MAKKEKKKLNRRTATCIWKKKKETIYLSPQNVKDTQWLKNKEKHHKNSFFLFGEKKKNRKRSLNNQLGKITLRRFSFTLRNADAQRALKIYIYLYLYSYIHIYIYIYIYMTRWDAAERQKMLRYVCRKTLRPVCLANLSAVCRCCAFFPHLPCRNSPRCSSGVPKLIPGLCVTFLLFFGCQLFFSPAASTAALSRDLHRSATNEGEKYV